jgi:hypothetical protein
VVERISLPPTSIRESDYHSIRIALGSPHLIGEGFRLINCKSSPTDEFVDPVAERKWAELQETKRNQEKMRKRKLLKEAKAAKSGL